MTKSVITCGPESQVFKDGIHLGVKETTDVDGDVKQAGVDEEADQLVGAL